jgi:DNA repair exonuclease SbcCD ATPase subunit
MPEQDASYRLRDAERQLERLEKEFEKYKEGSAAKIDRVQERVQTLETTRTVLIALAAIFGLAGSWGLIALQTAQSKISEMQAQVEQLQKGAKAVFEAEQQAVSDAKREIQDTKERQLVDFNSRLQEAAPRLQAQLNDLKQWTSYIYASASKNISNVVILGGGRGGVGTDHETLKGLEKWQDDLGQQREKVMRALKK